MSRRKAACLRAMLMCFGDHGALSEGHQMSLIYCQGAPIEIGKDFHQLWCKTFALEGWFHLIGGQRIKPYSLYHICWFCLKKTKVVWDCKIRPFGPCTIKFQGLINDSPDETLGKTGFEQNTLWFVPDMMASTWENSPGISQSRRPWNRPLWAHAVRQNIDNRNRPAS